MPPKEKANELYDKFFDTTVADITKAHRKAKQYAIIAVNEILNAIDYESPRQDFEVSYWQEVKNEIEKL